MKKILICVIAVLMAFSLFACDRGNEVSVGDGQELAGREAGNQAVDYSFAYPKEWDLVRNDGVIELELEVDESDKTSEFATITVLTFATSQTAKEYWEDRKEESEKLFVTKNEDGSFSSTFELLDTEEYGIASDTSDASQGSVDEAKPPLDDAPALKVKYKGEMNKKTYVTEQIICCRYGNVYLITLVVPENFYDSVSGVIPVIKNSFKFA